MASTVVNRKPALGSAADKPVRTGGKGGAKVGGAHEGWGGGASRGAGRWPGLCSSSMATGTMGLTEGLVSLQKKTSGPAVGFLSGGDC